MCDLVFKEANVKTLITQENEDLEPDSFQHIFNQQPKKITTTSGEGKCCWLVADCGSHPCQLRATSAIESGAVERQVILDSGFHIFSLLGNLGHARHSKSFQLCACAATIVAHPH